MKRIESVVLATTNQRKIEEYTKYLKEFMDCPIYSLNDFPDITLTAEENGETYEENAKIKATEAYEKLSEKGKYLIIADDSGIEIDALPGELGVHTARFISKETSYPEKVDEILRRMNDVKFTFKRNAYLKSTVYAIFPNGTKTFVSGNLFGRISDTKYGDDPLGFDSIFMVHINDKQRTELTINEIREKHIDAEISSRKVAANLLKYHIDFYETFGVVTTSLVEDILIRSKITTIYGCISDKEKTKVGGNGESIEIFFTMPEFYDENVPDINIITKNDLIDNIKKLFYITSFAQSDIGNALKTGYNKTLHDVISDTDFTTKFFKFFMKTRKGETWTLENYKEEAVKFEETVEKAINKQKETLDFEEV